ncbi:MAG: hypothetical protein ABEI75_04680 [Halobaculum sp.]
MTDHTAVGDPLDAATDARGVDTLQRAAVDHAFAVGPPEPGLRLAGRLEPVRGRDAAPAVLAALVVSLVAVGLDSDAVRPPRDGPPRSPDAPSPSGRGGEGSTSDPVIRGAAVAVARHDIDPGRAATAADRPLDRVTRAARRLDDASDTDRPDPA